MTPRAKDMLKTGPTGCGRDLPPYTTGHRKDILHGKRHHRREQLLHRRAQQRAPVHQLPRRIRLEGRFL